MKRKQQTKYCDNFKNRYSQVSQVPNKREMETSNFGKIYHPFQFITFYLVTPELIIQKPREGLLSINQSFSEEITK